MRMTYAPVKLAGLPGFIVLAVTLLASAESSSVLAGETSPAEPSEQISKKLEEAHAAAVKTEDGAVKSTVYQDADTLWTCLAAFLVFFMQAGFAMVEAGFTRAKNVCNILMKNLLDFCFGSIAYWAVGFGLMFGSAYFLFDGAKAVEDKPDEGFRWAFWLFQVVFCATAATIVSGAMAERTKFQTYAIYSVFISAVVYPIFGSWAWGNLYVGANGGFLTAPEGGLLRQIGLPAFVDFAGSTVVHSIGGWSALAGVLVIGNRTGRYDEIGPDGKVIPGSPIPGHNIPLAALGIFVLWLGWFGFNPGSTTAVGGGSFAKIAVVTNLAACAGAIAALLTTWVRTGKADPGMTFNGTLAGLVAITAGCSNLNPGAAMLVGFFAGVIVVFSVLLLDELKLDDPVGAISVHGVCGMWGTLACGLPFLDNRPEASWAQFGTQCIGVFTALLWALGTMTPFFLLLKYTVGLRVSVDEEQEGLDLGEHGYVGYAYFNDGNPTV